MTMVADVSVRHPQVGILPEWQAPLFYCEKSEMWHRKTYIPGSFRDFGTELLHRGRAGGDLGGRMGLGDLVEREDSRHWNP